MNEKLCFALFCAGLIIGALGAGIAARGYYTGRSAGEIAGLNRRYNQLDREYTERQRELEAGLVECIGYVESARAITERTGENAGRAIGNLREAIELVKQGIEERKNLEMELDNLRARLYGIRDMGGPGID